MTRRAGYAVLALCAALLLTACAAVYGLADRGESPRALPPAPREPLARAITGAWTGTWATAPVTGEPGTAHGLPGQSLRNVVHTSVGGTRVRIQLSNLFGTSPLTVTHASVAVALPGGGASAVPGTMRRLTFARLGQVTVPAGQAVVSDAAPLAVPADADLLVTTYSPLSAGPVTYHPQARQTSYAAHGQHTAAEDGAAYTRQVTHWRHLTAVDVWSTGAQGAVAVIGDSLTDGSSSTPDANHRWTDFLARRLRTEPGAPRYGVLNLGISGNRLLRDGGTSPASGERAPARFERDVLSRTGVRAVVVELGINDILKTPHETSPGRITAALRQLTQAAHARGLRVTGATLMPFAGHPRWSPALERVRTQVNRQIRAGGVFDAVVDFDAMVRDPHHPERLRTAYDCGDHLHLTDEGYEAMARLIDPAQLRGTTQAAL
ncbi:SGNH/GDSL hydrolase family protein [Streptomyces polyrhachis]|uniref:SGNH/GDSL hydrolase family protein n=1 Tax=Streptomyces polyrhachis TaxID=1282885 RepID=A0ABW2GFQ8_9ACTN